MQRVFWPAGLVIAFALGLAIGAQAWRFQGDRHDLERGPEGSGRPVRPASLDRSEPGAGEPGSGPHSVAAVSEGAAGRAAGRSAEAGASTVGLARPGQRAPGGDAERAPAWRVRRETSGAPPAATVEAALERFRRYLEDASELGRRGRWQRAEVLLSELRAMGSVGVEALVEILASSPSSEERRTAAQLLGELKAPGAVPALLDVLDEDSDVLMRRAAASALQRVRTPDAVSAMESLLADSREDRFVRMSAAMGLAQMGRPHGVAGLVQIFDESSADGRGRDAAFRVLSSLTDDRTLAFMRRLVTSSAEPSYRLQAIRVLASQGDRQAVAALQQVVQTPGEQPSLRDAAARAIAAIDGR